MSQHKDIIQFNCRGVRGQYHQLKQLIVEFSPAFILLQEFQIKNASDDKFKVRFGSIIRLSQNVHNIYIKKKTFCEYISNI